MTAHDLLATATAFKALSPQELEELATHVTARHFERGDAVVRQDEPAAECFVITSGSVAVTRRSQAEPPAGPLATLKAGDLFGEIAIIDGSTRSATVIALEPTECLVLPAGPLRDLLGRNRAFSMGLLQLSVIRLAEMERLAQ